VDVLPFSNPAAFALLVLAAVLTPGPTTLLLFVSGLQAGTRHALRLVLVAGAALTGIYILSGVALGLVVSLIDRGAVVLRIVAACYLCYLAWRIASTPIAPNGVPGKVVTGTAVVLVTLSNPKAWFFLTSIHIGTLAPRPGPGDIAIAALAFAGLVLPCLMLWSLGGAQLRRAIRTPAAGRTTAMALGCTILASVSMLFLYPVS
jgi:threonine/homoserine/homoserine lactone efflux protein